MNKAMKIKELFSVLLLACIMQCGGGDEVITEADTGSAVGFLYCDDGKAADRALIKAVPVTNLPISIPTRYFSHTDSKGKYVFSDLPAGDYNIYSTQDSLCAMLEGVAFRGTITLPNDTLKAPGKIEGVVRLSGGEDCRTVLIMAIGADANLITGPVDTTGAFTLGSLPIGQYRIRFMSTIRSYPVLDSTFNVISGKSTNIGTIILKGNL